MRALGEERDPAVAAELRSWAEAAEANGAVLASRTLWEDYLGGVIDADDLKVLWFCLGHIADAGGGEAVVRQRALGNSRSFKSSLDHLTVNEWLDSKPERAGYWRIRLGPAAQAERLARATR